jgi:hypothetical protein
LGAAPRLSPLSLNKPSAEDPHIIKQAVNVGFRRCFI